jgi:hypothetical protein
MTTGTMCHRYIMELYAREARNAVQFIAWVIGVAAIVTVVLFILTVVEAYHIASILPGGTQNGRIPGGAVMFIPPSSELDPERGSYHLEEVRRNVQRSQADQARLMAWLRRILRRRKRNHE